MTGDRYDRWAFTGSEPLYIGIVSGDAGSLENLLLDVHARFHPAMLNRTRVVVLDNGKTGTAHQRLAVVHRAREAGLATALVSPACQRRDFAGCWLDNAFARGSGPLGIADARSIIQKYVGTLMLPSPGSYAWILDDDLRLDERARDAVEALPRFRERGVGVVLCSTEGSSPNPILHGLGVQCWDLVQNLAWLGGLDPAAALPDRRCENAANRAAYPEYYYDLSRRHAGHLDAVFWIEPRHPGETVDRARTRLLAGSAGLLRGEPLTRPVLVPSDSDPVASARASTNRGAATLVLDPQPLLEMPNLAPRLPSGDARRSDMIWALLNSRLKGVAIQRASIAFGHAARRTPAKDDEASKSIAEIVGASVYRALEYLMVSCRRPSLDVSDAQIAGFSRAYEHASGTRVDSLRASLHRIGSLIPRLERYEATPSMVLLLPRLRQWAAPDTLDTIRSRVAGFDSHALRRFLNELDVHIQGFAAVRPDVSHIQGQFARPHPGARPC